jgi:hypothetical protein
MTILQILKYTTKKLLPARMVRRWNALGHLLGNEDYPEVPFDNTYPWLNYTFSELNRDVCCATRPMYVWGVAQGAALAKALGLPRISILEFGVAGGAGLLALERIAEAIEKRTNITIDVFGFDTGTGLPQPEDYRDQPNMWYGGQLSMDQHTLKSTLRRAKLSLGPVKETVPLFLTSVPAPIAFVSFDLDLYSSTRDAIQLFKGDYSNFLPRVVSYFDDIFGYTYNDFCGERLAITEFNDGNEEPKICPIHGLRFFIPRVAFGDIWPDGIYMTHFFTHPLYNVLDSINKPTSVQIDGTVIFRPVR